jgi:ATP-dependent DNA helicase PIF1
MKRRGFKLTKGGDSLINSTKIPKYNLPVEDNREEEEEEEEEVIIINVKKPVSVDRTAKQEPPENDEEQKELMKLIQVFGNHPETEEGSCNSDDETSYEWAYSGDYEGEEEYQKHKLSKYQRKVIDMALSGKSFLYTGSAGTGKSFVMKTMIHRLISQCPEKESSIFVTASTGAAAVLVGGTTVHSFAGIRSGEGTVAELHRMVLKSPKAKERWKLVKTLIIDEISMIDGLLLDKLEQLARRMKDKPSEVFGGIQVILCGDFAQLPPVKGGHAFGAKCWDSLIGKDKNFVVLRGNFRQKEDPKYASVLNEIRFGYLSEEGKQLLDYCRTPFEDRPVEWTEAERKIKPTILYPHKADVNRTNEMELSKLKGPVRLYASTDTCTEFTKRVLNNCPAPEQLKLKKGAQVILLKNLDFSRGLVNGSKGVVQSFSSGRGLNSYPVVLFSNGVILEVKEATWEIKTGDRRNKPVTRTQIPLLLAFAISIHKSQGMTLENVHMNLSRGWECGQAYVALSRASSTRGLFLEDYTPSKIRASHQVIRFHKSLFPDIFPPPPPTQKPPAIATKKRETTTKRSKFSFINLIK